MEWRGRRQSGNVLDRRGAKLAGGLSGGGLILALIYFLITGDPSQITLPSPQSSKDVDDESPRSDTKREFIGVILADTEDVWHQLLPGYQEPQLVLFSGRVGSACGMATSAVGPFYCPSDAKVYLDLDFFTELETRLGAGGDFAQAYVIAHEIGHHVQNLLGTFRKVEEQRSNLSTGEFNRLSVNLELQADCYAGIWARETERSKHVLESGDLKEAINAAAAVGDDRLQKKSRGYVVPDSFTHGSSEQRVQWLERGLNGKRMEDCNTFEISH